MGRVGYKTCSVIIPAYNAADTIAATLESVFAQTVPPIEVIVADDGSTDNTAKIAADLGAKVLKLQNGGPGRARNAAARESTGDVLFFIDADDSWKSNKIALHMDAYATAEPAPSFVFDLTQRIRTDGRYSGLAGFGRPGVVQWDELLDSGNWTCGSCPSMPRKVFEGIGGFSESLRFAEDVELLILAAHEFGPGHRINEVGTFYQLRPGSLSRMPHDPYKIVAEFKTRLPYLTSEQRFKILETIVMVNALHSKPGEFFAACQPIGLRALRDRRFYRFMALRLLNALHLRPL